MTFNLFLAGSDSAPSLLPRGFSIIVPKVFDTGFQTFWFYFYFPVLRQHFSKIVPAGALLGPCNFGDGGLGWNFRLELWGFLATFSEVQII